MDQFCSSCLGLAKLLGLQELSDLRLALGDHLLVKEAWPRVSDANWSDCILGGGLVHGDGLGAEPESIEPGWKLAGDVL